MQKSIYSKVNVTGLISHYWWWTQLFFSFFFSIFFFMGSKSFSTEPYYLLDVLCSCQNASHATCHLPPPFSGKFKPAQLSFTEGRCISGVMITSSRSSFRPFHNLHGCPPPLFYAPRHESKSWVSWTFSIRVTPEPRYMYVYNHVTQEGLWMWRKEGM